MCTRIQSQHPITEEITGVDIIEEQINIANNLQLAFTQADLLMQGHAIEARIYAEDPKTFFPSPGHITTFDLPEAGYIRQDRKSTRLNSSHVAISYAVFCLKKKQYNKLLAGDCRMVLL